MLLIRLMKLAKNKYTMWKYSLVFIRLPFPCGCYWDLSYFQKRQFERQWTIVGVELSLSLSLTRLFECQSNEIITHKRILFLSLCVRLESFRVCIRWGALQRILYSTKPLESSGMKREKDSEFFKTHTYTTIMYNANIGLFVLKVLKHEMEM